MPVIRISEDQKQFLHDEMDERFAEDVSYRVILGEIIEEYKEG